MVVFLVWTPLPLWIRVLFVFGYFPLFEYSVVARGNGLAMLFLFAFCALYPHRARRPVAVAAVLALLANSTALGFVVAAAAGLMVVVDALTSGERGSPMRAVVLAVVVYLAGMAHAVASNMPDPSVLPLQLYHHDARTVLAALVQAVAFPAACREPALAAVSVALHVALLRRAPAAPGVARVPAREPRRLRADVHPGLPAEPAACRLRRPGLDGDALARSPVVAARAAAGGRPRPRGLGPSPLPRRTARDRARLPGGARRRQRHRRRPAGLFVERAARVVDRGRSAARPGDRDRRAGDADPIAAVLPDEPHLPHGGADVPRLDARSGPGRPAGRLQPGRAPRDGDRPARALWRADRHGPRMAARRVGRADYVPARHSNRASP